VRFQASVGPLGKVWSVVKRGHPTSGSLANAEEAMRDRLASDSDADSGLFSLGTATGPVHITRERIRGLPDTTVPIFVPMLLQNQS
jgi:hypothetical protein